ncbi:MAG: hypothetical protein GC164_01250 [Phycisphaera sp.]|nr:hypothetical protein [Phycisphaera sp.]
MKFGILISIALVLVIGVAGFLTYRGTPTPPTAASMPAALKAQTLPDSLPRINPQAGSGQGQAVKLYLDAFKLYNDNSSKLTNTPMPPALADPIAQKMIQAAKAPEPEFGFLDSHWPMVPGGEADIGDALALAAQVVQLRAGDLVEAGDKTKAADYLRATWTLGERALRLNTRLDPRVQGMQIMMASGSALFEADPSMQDKLNEWVTALNGIERTWSAKIAAVRSTRPNVSDLINIAEHDEDKTFRLDATLYMGRVKFNPGSRGNMRVLNNAIDRACTSDDPQIADAGRWAKALTVEEYRKLR